MAEEEGLLGGEEPVACDGVGGGGTFSPVCDELGGTAYRVGDPADEVGAAAGGGRPRALAGDEGGDGDGVQGGGVGGGAFEPGSCEAVPSRGGPQLDGDEQSGAG